jgi:16S rRNA processing protein RimM
VAQSETLELGYVSRAHGLHGEVEVRPFDATSETLLDVDRLLLKPRDGEPRTLEVTGVRPTGKGFLVTFEDVEGRSAAEALVGATVLVFREDLEPPGEGEFFQGDLVGLVAVDEQGVELGRVQGLMDTGPVPNLIIRKDGAKAEDELLVPFTDDFVPTVDLEKGRVVVRPPEWVE